MVWSDLNPLIKIESHYQAGKMTQFQRSQYIDNSWAILENLTYQYTGGNLTEENWEGTIYGEYRPVEKFSYNDKGNMISRESNEGPGGDKMECFYEAGKGNIQQIQKPGGGIKFYLGFPGPTK